MYLTKFHKTILNEIWKRRSPKSKKDFNLDVFLEFYFTWYQKKYRKEIYSKGESSKNDCIFSGYLLSPKNQYLVKNKYKREMILALRELATLLKFLDTNDLINLVEKDSHLKFKGTHPECIPLFIEEQKDSNIYEPFTEGLKKVTEYLGKNIQVREGYKKFRRFNYRSHEELLQIIMGIWLPIIAILITIIIEILKKYSII